MFSLMFYHCHFVEHAIKVQKVVGLETSPAKKTLPNPHYRNTTHLYADSSLQCESEKTEQLTTAACPNIHSEEHQVEDGYAIPVIDAVPLETKDETNKVLLGSGRYEKCIELNENVAYLPSKVDVCSKTQDLSAADQEGSPSPHYEAIQGLQNQMTVDTARSPSPEYAEIVSKDKLYQEAEMEEQHHYHSCIFVHDYSSIAEIDEPNSSSQ